VAEITDQPSHSAANLVACDGCDRLTACELIHHERNIDTAINRKLYRAPKTAIHLKSALRHRVGRP